MSVTVVKIELMVPTGLTWSELIGAWHTCIKEPCINSDIPPQYAIFDSIFQRLQGVADVSFKS